MGRNLQSVLLATTALTAFAFLQPAKVARAACDEPTANGDTVTCDVDRNTLFTTQGFDNTTINIVTGGRMQGDNAGGDAFRVDATSNATTINMTGTNDVGAGRARIVGRANGDGMVIEGTNTVVNINEFSFIRGNVDGSDSRAIVFDTTGFTSVTVGGTASRIVANINPIDTPNAGEIAMEDINATGGTQLINVNNLGLVNGRSVLGGGNDNFIIAAGGTVMAGGAGANPVIDFGDGTDFLSLAGTLTGTAATTTVQMGAGNDSMLLSVGLSYTGNLDGGSGSNRLNLTGSGSDTLDLSTIFNFERLTVSGGTWTVQNTIQNPTLGRLDRTLIVSGGSSVLNVDTALTVSLNTLVEIGGTLNIQNSRTLTTNGVSTIETGGTLNVQQGGTLTANNGVVVNDGTFVVAGMVNGTGLVFLINGSAVLDGDADGGTLGASNDVFVTAAGTTVTTAGNMLTFNGAFVINSGGNSAAVNGTLIANQGATVQNGSMLTVNGAMTNNDTFIAQTGATTTVAAGGTLTANADVTNSGTLNVDGTVNGASAFTNTGSVNFGGVANTLASASYTQDAGSTNFQIDDGGGVSTITTQAFTFNGGSVNVNATGTNFNLGDQFLLVDNNGAGASTLDPSVALTTNIGAFLPQLQIIGGDLFLVLNPLAAILGNDAPQTPNQISTAEDLLTLAGNPGTDLNTLLQIFNALTPDQQRLALDTLSGEQYGAGQSARVEAFHNFFSLLQRRLNLGGGTDGQDNAFAGRNYQIAGGEGATLIAAPAQVEGRDGRSMSAWAETAGLFGSRDGDGNGFGFDYYSAGVAGGLDAWVSRTVRVGVALGYAQLGVDSDNPGGGEIDAESVQAALYGRYLRGGLRVDASVGVGLNWYDSSRAIIIGGARRTAEGDYSGVDVGASVEIGYTIDMGIFNFEPSLGFTYARVHTDGFTETGTAGGLALNVGDMTTHSGRVRGGVTLSERYATSFGWVEPSLRVGMSFEVLDDNAVVSRRFVASSAPFATVQGAAADRVSGEVAAGLTAQLSAAWSFSGQYRGEFSGSDRVHAASLRATYRW